MICERCNVSNRKILFQSVFNEQNICLNCKEKEEKHKDFYKAIIAIENAYEVGDYNFKGVGLPEDLSLNNKNKPQPN